MKPKKANAITTDYKVERPVADELMKSIRFFEKRKSIEIYVVVKSFGSWDTYRTKVLIAFSNELEANNFIDKKRSQLEKLRKYVYETSSIDEHGELDISADDNKYWFKHNILETNGYTIVKTKMFIYDRGWDIPASIIVELVRQHKGDGLEAYNKQVDNVAGYLKHFVEQKLLQHNDE